MPFLTLFVALAVEEAGEALDWIAFAGQQIGLGVLTGVVVGMAGGAALEAADRRGWVNAPFRQLTVVALAVLAWAGADALGGNGFIAAFVAGLATGALIEDSGEDLLEFTEDEGQLLTAIVFFVFGVTATGFLEAVSPAVVGYAALSLTLLRMLPVALALLGAGLRPTTVLLLGWLGPRGAGLDHPGAGRRRGSARPAAPRPGHGHDGPDRARQHRAPRGDRTTARAALRTLRRDTAR